MNTLFKNTLLAAVGAAVLTKEKLDSTFKDFVKQGRISSADARVLANKIARQGRKDFVAASADAGASLKKLIARADRETQSRIDEVVARVRKLERQPAAGRAKSRKKR